MHISGSQGKQKVQAFLELPILIQEKNLVDTIKPKSEPENGDIPTPAVKHGMQH